LKTLSRKPKQRRRPRPSTIALASGVVIVVMFAVYARLSGGDAGPLTYPTYTAEQIAQGEQYYQANCATCHGATGAGNSRAGIPALDGSMHAWHHPDSQIAAMIRQGGFMMPAVGPDWSDEQITAVTAYIKEWWTPQQRAAQARLGGTP